MRKLIDIRCSKCGQVDEDRYVDVDELDPHQCGGYWERVPWTSRMGRAASAHQDSIEGGMEIHNGLCNSDGSPKKYYSKREIAFEAERRGLTNYVRHQPDRGSDKSRHTVRWV